MTLEEQKKGSMKEQILKIADDLRSGAIDENKAKALLLDVLNNEKYWPSWLTVDDFTVAKLYYQSGEKLLAVKHLSLIAAPYIENRLAWAKMFVETYC